jgi:LAO/AO transport system kinase
VVNKADGDQEALAARTRNEHEQALQLLRHASASWAPRVLVASAATGTGIEAFWETVLEHGEVLEASGERQARRRAQAREWMWNLVREGLARDFAANPDVAGLLPTLEKEVEAQETTPAAAARALLATFQKQD